jgi:hypothetical protein
LNPAVVPTPENFDAAAAATSAYLQTSVEEFYSQSPFSEVVGFSGIATGDNGAGDPAVISFDVTLIFSPDSAVVPTPDALDVLVDTALSPPAVNKLLEQLSALGPDNPFSNTVNAEYSPGSTAPQENLSSQGESSGSRSTTQVHAFFIESVAAAAATLMVVIGFLTMRKRRRKSPEEWNEESVIHHAATKIDTIVENDEFDNLSVVATDTALSEKDSVSPFEEATQDLD